MKKHYQQTATSVAQVSLQAHLLNTSSGGGKNGMSAIRTSYGSNPEEIWE